MLEHPNSELGQSAGKQLIKLVESSETKGKTCVFFICVLLRLLSIITPIPVMQGESEIFGSLHSNS